MPEIRRRHAESLTAVKPVVESACTQSQRARERCRPIESQTIPLTLRNLIAQPSVPFNKIAVHDNDIFDCRSSRRQLSSISRNDRRSRKSKPSGNV
ncbi:hypothetical protein U1Q18_051507 [Sarracenia purpurea var. burkii]